VCSIIGKLNETNNVLLLIFVTYIGGFVSGVKKIFPYDIARQIKVQMSIELDGKTMIME
tara:strand:+ start:429 stop:605 length:177 start_codon:yes stop_codon:yes gene_type:complete